MPSIWSPAIAEATSLPRSPLRTEQSVSPSGFDLSRHAAIGDDFKRFDFGYDLAHGTEVPLFCTQNPGNLIATRATLTSPNRRRHEMKILPTIIAAALGGAVFAVTPPVALGQDTIRIAYTDPLSGPFAQVGDANL